MMEILSNLEHAAVGMLFQAEFFEIEDFIKARSRANQQGFAIYSWKTTGRHNGLERKVSIVDTLGLALLPKNFLDTVEMLADELEVAD